jgi:ActR/RegA family two-component response regulator
MSEKILVVDDDANLLASCERNLRRRFQVETAEGGAAGLQKIDSRGPYAGGHFRHADAGDERHPVSFRSQGMRP